MRRASRLLGALLVAAALSSTLAVSTLAVSSAPAGAQSDDFTPPTFNWAEVNGAKLTMHFSENLDSNYRSHPRTIQLLIDGGTYVSSKNWWIGNNRVNVNLNTAITACQEVWVKYEIRDPSWPRIRDAAGNQVGDFGPVPVTNNTASTKPCGLRVTEQNQKVTFSWNSVPADSNMKIQFKTKAQAWSAGEAHDLAANATSWEKTGLTNDAEYAFRVKSDKSGATWATFEFARPTNRSSAPTLVVSDRTFLSGVELSSSSALYPEDQSGSSPGGATERNMNNHLEVRWKVKAAADSTYTAPSIIPVQSRRAPTSIIIAPAGPGLSIYDRRLSLVGVTQFLLQVDDLRVGTEYTFQMRSDRGNGAWASVDHVIPYESSAAGLFGVPGDKRAVLSWSRSMLVTNSMEYRYKESAAADSTYTAVTDVPDINAQPGHWIAVTGLDNGTEYTFQVRSDLGNGNWGTVDVTPAAETTDSDLPKPKNLAAELDVTGEIPLVTLTWDAVTSDGDFLYAVRYAKTSESYPKDERDYDAWYFLHPGLGHEYKPANPEVDTPTFFYAPAFQLSFASPRFENGQYKFEVAVANFSYQVGPPSDSVTQTVVTELARPVNVEITPDSGFSGVNRVGGFHLKSRAVEFAEKYQYRYAPAAPAQSDPCAGRTYSSWADLSNPRYHNFRFQVGWEERWREVHNGDKTVRYRYFVRKYQSVSDVYLNAYPAGMALGTSYCVQLRGVTGSVESDPTNARLKNTGIGGSGPLADSVWFMTPLRRPPLTTGLSSMSGDGQAKLCWNQPADTDLNTPGIQTNSTTYAIRGWQYSLNNGPWEWLGNIVGPPAGPSPTRVCSVVRGLTNGRPYWISVRPTAKGGGNFPDFTLPYVDPTTYFWLLPGNSSSVGANPVSGGPSF